MRKNGVLLFIAGLLVTGCTPKVDPDEVSEMLVKPTRGLIGGFEIGDSWEEIKANKDKRYTVREDQFLQLRYDLSDPGENGCFVSFGVDKATKKVTSLSANVYGEKPNAAAVLRVMDDFTAKFNAKFGQGYCDGKTDPSAPGINCSWGPDKNTPVVRASMFVLKDYGTASLTVTVEPVRKSP